MPKLKNKRKGKRVNVWLPERHFKIWSMLENKSKFLQIALNDATGVMAWGILHERDPKQFYSPEKIEDTLPEFNKTFPLDPLTQKRKDKQQWQNSPKKPELW